jgi:RNA polymerase sigma-70 factor, ECF subfamily
VEDMDLLIEQVRNGNERAFGKIYDQFYRMVASVLRKVARCPGSEMDFHMNEVFFRVYKGVFSFKGRSKFSTYVYRIALNYSYQLSKKLRRHGKFSAELDENVSEDKPGFDDNVVDTLFMEDVLDSLSEKLRSVTVMFYYDRLSIKEISEITGVSETAVKNRLYQAREKIKSYIEEKHSEGF